MDRIAVVTGAESGIGLASAQALARSGFHVGITWHEDENGADRALDAIRAHGHRAESAYLDLNTPEAGAEVVEGLAERLGGLSVLVNNAGTGGLVPFLDLTMEEWYRVLNIDLLGAFACAKAAATMMIAHGHGGRIINITSIQAEIPRSGAAAYSAAKAALTMLTRSMALELGEQRITVNAVSPGEIATRMSGLEGIDVTQIRRPNLPLGRPGRPEEVADLVAWLASEQSSYLTGASLTIDGGLTLTAVQSHESQS